MTQLYQTFLTQLRTIPAIDTHQHLRLAHDSRDRPSNLTWNFESIFVRGSYLNYLHNGLKSMHNAPESFLEKIPWMRTTSTFRSSVEIPLRELYGCEVDELDARRIAEIDDRIAENYRHGSHTWCKKVFDRAQIVKGFQIKVSLAYFENVLPSLSESDRKLERELFETVWCVDDFIVTNPWLDHQGLADRFDIHIDSLDGYLALIDQMFEVMLSYGCCALKIVLAYVRTLRVENVSLTEARSLYADRAHDNKRLHDFLWRYMAKKAGQYDLPVVIHTGMVADPRLTTECNPALLSELLVHEDCAQTRFVLIHTGYPHARELVVLAWNTPNVFIDFVWLPVLGFESACQILGEFLEWAPLHKFTMGTDCHQPETTYGAMVQSREILAHVLAKKCKRGIWTEETAMAAAQAILHDNAMSLYDLG